MANAAHAVQNVPKAADQAPTTICARIVLPAALLTGPPPDSPDGARCTPGYRPPTPGHTPAAPQGLCTPSMPWAPQISWPAPLVITTADTRTLKVCKSVAAAPVVDVGLAIRA